MRGRDERTAVGCVAGDNAVRSMRRQGGGGEEVKEPQCTGQERGEGRRGQKTHSGPGLGRWRRHTLSEEGEDTEGVGAGSDSRLHCSVVPVMGCRKGWSDTEDRVRTTAGNTSRDRTALRAGPLSLRPKNRQRMDRHVVDLHHTPGNGEGSVGLQGMQRGSAGRCRGCKGTGALGSRGRCRGCKGAGKRV
jgi:hypothetical protein